MVEKKIERGAVPVVTEFGEKIPPHQAVEVEHAVFSAGSGCRGLLIISLLFDAFLVKPAVGEGSVVAPRRQIFIQKRFVKIEVHINVVDSGILHGGAVVIVPIHHNALYGSVINSVASSR